MHSYGAVLFDFYGTLTRAVRRGPLHHRIARAIGCPPEELAAVLDRSFRTRSCGVYGDAAATLRWLCRQVDAYPTSRQLRGLQHARVAAVRADTQLRPDAVSALQAIRRRGLRTAVISDCSHELPELLPKLPVAPLLDARVFSVQVGHCKPHPAMYLTACESLGVDPADCLYVGDGGGRELTGATALGMTAVRLAAPDLAHHLVFEADEGWEGPTVSSLTEVAELATSSSALG